MNRFIIILMLFSSLPLLAQNNKPFWVDEKVLDGNGYCDFILVQAKGTSLDAVRSSCLKEFYSKLNVTHRITYNTKLELNSIKQTYANDSIKQQEIVSENFSSIVLDSSVVDIKYKFIDEYLISDGLEYSSVSLFAVDNPNEQSTYSIYISDDYRDSKEMFWIPIPGAAQFAKHSYVKGGLILSGMLISGLGIGVSEYQKTKAHSLMLSVNDESYKKQYARIANNMMVTRNICIGILSSIYLYNIFDAIFSPGKERFKIVPYISRNNVMLATSLSF